jgi:hypothetical protein
MALIVISDWEPAPSRVEAAELPHILPEQDVVGSEVRWPSERSFHDVPGEAACVAERSEGQQAQRSRVHTSLPSTSTT